MSYINQIVEDGVTYDIQAKALDSTLDATILKKSNLVNGFTQTTPGVNALDAAAGKSLNDSLANLSTDVSTNYATKTDLTNIVKIQSVTATETLASGASVANGSITLPTITGYTPISLLNHTVGGSGSTSVVVYATFLTSNAAHYKVHNYGTNQATPTIEIYVLYMKTEFIS